jgi:type IV secretion system protein VirD4
VADIQSMTNLLVDPDGKGLEDHWAKTGQALLAGIVAYVLERRALTGEPATLASVDETLADPDIDILWQRMLSAEIEPHLPLPRSFGASGDLCVF